jgi:peptidoglycan biosynthesis protein MviN/MurJ (putative lipid II flippase)
MEVELKRIGIKLIGTLLITPIMGWVLLKNVDWIQKAWKSNKRINRWLVMCTVFFFLAVIGGWLQ